MILVHKPQSHFATLPTGAAYNHRRHPSAPLPALVATVQPTKTPGLLSLSKPIQPVQHQRTRVAPKLKQQHKSPQPAHAVALQPPAEIVAKQPAKLSQSPEKRGRQAPATIPKAKSVPRSVSKNCRIRQPSPPISSQAEVSPTTPTNKPPPKPFFDSFLDDSPPRPPPVPALKLATRPTGKLARRRQAIPSFEMPTKAIPVPTTHRNRMPLNKRASAPADFGTAFPVCDDISEVGATDVEGEDTSAPSTPTRPQRSAGRYAYTYGFDDGPKTAPLTSSASMPTFPFASSSTSLHASLRGSPVNAKRAGYVRPRRHHRTPSEGVFQMSDEEPSGSSEDLKLLFGTLGPKQRAMFASSTFLNSPDPEELPPPSF